MTDATIARVDDVEETSPVLVPFQRQCNDQIGESEDYSSDGDYLSPSHFVIICPHCLQTYWVPLTTADMNFLHFGQRG